MKIIIVGGTGTIGGAIFKELSPRHELIVAANKSGDIRVDITSLDSIKKMYQDVGKCDAVIAAVGQVCFEDFNYMNSEKYLFGLQNKLMGQVNLVLIGRHYLSETGSFTLTSGILSQEAVLAGSSASMVNGALNSFVKTVAIEMPHKIRINCVSPTILSESQELYGKYFRGFQPVTAAQVALAFSKSVEGLQTGQVYAVGHSYAA